MSASELLEGSLVDVANAVRDGRVSASELADVVLARIARDDTNSHLDVDPDRTRAQAKRIDEKRARGEALGPLAGVPIGLKDVLCTSDAQTTCGSRILEGYTPPYDATAVARLRSADAVFTGKLNMDEFAMGSSNENSAYGPVKNPWDRSRVPGGSSGGSAAAVAAGLALGTLGTDTGGSIRQPASLCGVVGVKPTYGRVSRYGLVAFASSLDQIGTFARDVRGAARLLEVIAGRDPHDATSVEHPIDTYVEACGRDPKGLRLGVPREYFEEGLDPAVNASIEVALKTMQGLGCELVPIEMPNTKYAVATYYVLATAECSSNLARFDGVRYGLRVEGRDLESMYGATRDRGFGAEVKRRILLGTYVLSAGYYDAYYTKAQKVRTLIRRDFDAAFAKVDAIVGPTSPSVAWPLGEKVDDPLKMYLADVYTLPASLAGLPGISVPAAPSVGLPVGLQIVTPAFTESRLFTLAHAFEQVSPAKGLTAVVSEGIRVADVRASDFAALAALFERDSSPCYCRFWHFTGTNKEWEARCAFEPTKNRDELARALVIGDAQASGLVARPEGDTNRIIGWMKLTPRRTLTKLLLRAPYKGLDDGTTPATETLAIGCFLVDPEHRHRGVARALVEGALVSARRQGARFVEAYPRVATNIHDAEAWTGPHSIFVELGFEIAREAPQYPVMRKAV